MSGIDLDARIDKLLAFVGDVAMLRTSEEIDMIEDEDIQQELYEEDMQGVRDTLDRIIFKARALERKKEQ